MSRGRVAGCPQHVALGPRWVCSCMHWRQLRFQGNAAHAEWWQCPGAALVQATTTGMESLCAPAAAPAGPAALGDMLHFSLRQAGSTGEMELVLPLQSQGVSPARSTPAGRMATQVNFEQGAARVLPALTSQVGIICCIGEGARCSQVTGRQTQGCHLGECRSV